MSTAGWRWGGEDREHPLLWVMPLGELKRGYRLRKPPIRSGARIYVHRLLRSGCSIFWLCGFLSQLPRQDLEVLCFLVLFKGTFDWCKGSKKDGRVKLQRFEKFLFWNEGFCYN